MEKQLDISYQKVIWRIVDAVRRQAWDIPVFRDSRNGCIRITVVPLSRSADEWLGGMNDYSYGHLGTTIVDICEREFVFKINPLGSHTIQYTCEDGHKEPVNCYGYSALKTAWASWERRFRATVQDKNLGETFSDFQYRQQTQFFTEDNGWSMHDGSVYSTITIDGEEFMRLYVCVSGAKSTEDKECALAGMLEAQRCLGLHKPTVKFDPYIKEDCTPIRQE